MRVCAGTNVRAVRGLWLNSQLSVKYKFQRERRRPGAGVRLKDERCDSTVSILILSRRLPLYEVISL